jgi:hypothetical protein
MILLPVTRACTPVLARDALAGARSVCLGGGKKVRRKEALEWANLVDPLRTAVLEAVQPKKPVLKP